MEIICLEEKSIKIAEDGSTQTRINDTSLFSDIMVARYSAQWKMACYKYAGDDKANLKYQSLSKLNIDTGEARYISLVERSAIGNCITKMIEDDRGIIYMLEIINNVDEQEFIDYDKFDAYKPLSDISRTYYTNINDALASDIWQYFVNRYPDHKYEFKSHYATHYIDIVNRRSVNIKPMVIRIKNRKRGS